jgi:hypothetical protein
VAAATAPAHSARSAGPARARHSSRPAATRRKAASAAPATPRSVNTWRYSSWAYWSTLTAPPRLVHRRVCPGPTPASGCAAMTRIAAVASPDRAGEARVSRARVSAPTAARACGARKTPGRAAARAAPAMGSTSFQPEERCATMTSPSPAASATAANTGRAGAAARRDGRRPSSATPAPATGPAAARATRRAPSSRHSTSSPAPAAAKAARLSVSPVPSSRQVTVRDRATDLGAAVSRASATSASGTSKPAVAFA